MFHTTCERPWLVARFPQMQRMVSWSLARPGFVDAAAVAWLEVGNAELCAVDDPERWFREKLSARGLADAVGMMTARNVARHERAVRVVEGLGADCLVTLGLNNGEHVGERVGAHLHPLNAGTINILCALSVPVTDGALLEAASIVTQARTVALMEAAYRRPGRREIVTGTGTDCIVVCAPLGPAPTPYAGMHTALGEAVGDAVLSATRAAIRAWRADYGQEA